MEVVSTGSTTIDFATGIGGVPRGRLVEIFGREGVGKNSLLYYMMAEEQKRGRYVGFINLEGNLDPKWAATIAGLDINGVVVAEPKPGTDAIRTLYRMVTSGQLGMVGFDSVGAMLGDKEQDPLNSRQAGGQSALVTHMAKMIRPVAWENRCTVVFLNQVRDVFDAMFPLEEAPGGHAVKHMAVIRMHLKPGRNKIEGVVNKEKMKIGGEVVALIKKNLAGAPNQKATYMFWNYPSPEGVIGIDRAQEVIDLALRLDVIERAGAYYRHDSFPDGQLQGKEAVGAFLRTNQDAFEAIRTDLMEIAFSTEQEPQRETLTV
jgi:recombination protein RecA